MLELSDQRELVKKVGGIFKLCSMIQKRMRELVMGARPLVEVEFGERRDLLAIIIREIEEGKVAIAEEGEASMDLQLGGAAELMGDIDLDELRSVVSDEDLNILLPGDDDEENKGDDTAGLTILTEPVAGVSTDEEEEGSPGDEATDEVTAGDAEVVDADAEVARHDEEANAEEADAEDGSKDGGKDDAEEADAEDGSKDGGKDDAEEADDEPKNEDEGKTA